MADVNAGIFKVMQTVDPDAVWYNYLFIKIYIAFIFQLRVMQAWLFLSGFWTPDRVKSYLSKVPIVWITLFFYLNMYISFDFRAILFFSISSLKRFHNIHVLNLSMDIIIFGICYMILVVIIFFSVL